ncbi:type II toxin-antitoxin system VapB family antitoxin [Aquipuribacter nitratireducens]|uniref:Type II toxin-antitoxin system VapB family antitoxin n=1 Tax=Aquipuribacter nitratireducens TaxID=650104 RepID=A0ABW0GN26_9MICO
MRTTLNLDDDLVGRAKAEALRSGRTLTSVIEDALRESLSRAAAGEGTERFELRPFSGDGLQPGVDLDDTASLLDLMERG